MKTSSLLFCSIFLSTMIIAQPKTSFGVRGGIISSTLKGDAVKSLEGLADFADVMITTSNRTAYFGGVFANVPLSRQLSVEPGITYSQKGYQMNGAINSKGLDFLGINAKATLNMEYIDFPLLIKANVSQFRLFAGPQFSYLLKSDLATTAGLLGVNLLNNTMTTTQLFNRWDTGLTGGVEYRFTNGLAVSAAYDHGLSKADANKNMDVYNRSYKLGLSMSL